MVFNATFNNISVVYRQSVLLVEEPNFLCQLVHLWSGTSVMLWYLCYKVIKSPKQSLETYVYAPFFIIIL
jgi:hypothetical protein